MFIKFCKDKSIDGTIISEVNTKWTTLNIERMKRKLIVLNRNIEMITTDSSDYNLTDYEWLPEGLMTAFWGPIVSVLDTTKIIIDNIGK